ncbi:ATP-dependent RNA helicase dbp6 [Coemansia sp. RSA 486]|nr:ATP-dependent RNA helicase dbp6 [Coemansia sp. RSA 486]
MGSSKNKDGSEKSSSSSSSSSKDKKSKKRVHAEETGEHPSRKGYSSEEEGEKPLKKQKKDKKGNKHQNQNKHNKHKTQKTDTKDKKQKKDKKGKDKSASSSHVDDSNSDASLDKQTRSENEEPDSKDGLRLFPDFSGEIEASVESTKRAARLGVPQWLAHPTTIDRDATAGLDEKRFALSAHAHSRCAKAGIESLFAVQSAVVPVLRAAHSLTRLRQHVRDLCVSAPTGSGKTLAYVIPIVEKLRTRLVVRLRALVVLPTKDLAHQVKECFEFFCSGTGLRVGIATGDVSMAKEQAALVGQGTKGARSLSGGSSQVDILVSTPGRLFDHLSMTKGFTLQHLEFWVMDEADRLLSEANEEWLTKVHAAIEQEVIPNPNSSPVPYPDACTRRSADARLELLAQPPPRIQKLLFSATLTADPAKLARLKLVRPLYIAVTHNGSVDADGHSATYTFPSTLSEFFSICPDGKKPLWLMYMLWEKIVCRGICFTKSLETAHRLAQLLQAWSDSVPADEWPGGSKILVAEYSSDIPHAERVRIMRLFKNGEINMLICSDLIARGMDVDQIESVVNYDVPTDMSQYTHRVGRTARAGKEGTAYTLVGLTQAAYFKSMMKENGHWDGSVKRFDPRNKIMDKLRDQFKQALEAVNEFYG